MTNGANARERDPVAAWVTSLNRIAGEMDEICVTTHPSAWHEQTADLRDKYVKLAKRGPKQ